MAEAGMLGSRVGIRRAPSCWQRVITVVKICAMAGMIGLAIGAAPAPPVKGDDTMIRDLLADRATWKVAGANRFQSLRWDAQGRLALESESPERVLQGSHVQRYPLNGGTLRVEFRFSGAPEEAASAGIQIDGLATAKGQMLSIAIMPAKAQIQVGDERRPISPHDEDPYFFDLELVFGESRVDVFWKSRPFETIPVTYLSDRQGIVATCFMSTVSFERLTLKEGAASAAVSRDYTPIALDLGGVATSPLASPWADYFGTHYARSAELAGIAWRTVRSYGGAHTGIEGERDAASPVRKGPFTGRELRVGLRDFHAPPNPRRELMTAEQTLPQLIAHRIDAINLVSNIVRPSMEPFDKDLAYWAIRMMHESYPELKERMFWEIGNEIVSGHFDPMGVKDSSPRLAADGKVFGYDIDWKLDFYVNRYLAPAVEAIERASRDVYGDPLAIEVLVGSMNPYNSYNLQFLAKLMESTFDGREAPTLKGEAVWKHFDLLNVHYMTGSDATMATMQDYLDRYVRTGKVRGIWITEDHGGGGKGPVTVADRALRFLAWVAKNGLTADQARMVWYGIDAARAGGSGGELAVALGKFFKDRRVFLVEQRAEKARYVVLAGAPPEGDLKTARAILVAVMPEPSAFVDVGTLALEADLAAREWMAEATQYSSLAPPEMVAASVMADGAGLKISLSRRVSEPLLVWLSAGESGNNP